MNTSEQAIGSVFPFEWEPDHKKSTSDKSASILQSWSAPAKAVHCFHNARSCLHFTLTDLQIRRIWLPAYLCPETLQATKSRNVAIYYYPVSRLLEPDLQRIEKSVRNGDAILTINYFGRPPSADIVDFMAGKPEILWIEDCAQTIVSKPEMPSDIRIYSPRKIFGVPDGGILVDKNKILSEPEFISLQGDEFMLPYKMRADDPSDQANAIWFEAFQKSEQQHDVSMAKVSNISKLILGTAPIASVVGKRKNNYDILFNRLNGLALFPDPPDGWVPFCFPIRFDKAVPLCDLLAYNRIYPPRYWRNLPSPKADFQLAHDLSEQLIGLPCDQRYGRKDMERIISTIERFVP